MKPKQIFAALVIAVTISTAPAAQAATAPDPVPLGHSINDQMVKIDGNGVAAIRKFNVCKTITNAGSFPIMIPLGSAEEWAGGPDSFVSNVQHMPGVTATPCGPIDLAFCYFSNISGSTSQGAALCGAGTNAETGGPFLRFTNGAFDSSPAVLAAIIGAGPDAS